MNITAITPTQLLLWTLLTFLLAWLVTFAVLAIRRIPDGEYEQQESAIQHSVTTTTKVSASASLGTTMPRLAAQRAFVHTKSTNEMVLER